MRIFTNNTYKPSFKEINLSKDDDKKASELFYGLKTSINDDTNESIRSQLFEIFAPYLKKEIEEKGNKPWILKNDFAQEVYYKFFNFLINIKEQNISFVEFIAQLNHIKPTAIDRNPETDCYSWAIKHYTTSLVTDYEAREELNLLTKNSLMQDINEQILSLRSKGKTYKEIAQILDVSETTVKRRLQNSIGKIQIENDILPQELESLTKELKTRFNLDVELKEIQDKLREEGIAINYKSEELIEKIEKLSSLLNLSEKEIAEIALKYPIIWTMNPYTIDKKLKEVSNLLKITKEELIQAFSKSPFFIKISPEHISDNVKLSAEKLNIEEKDFIKTALKLPQLFYQKPETIEKYVNDGCGVLGVSKETFISTAIKNPRLFTSDFNKILNNLKAIAQYINVDLEEIVKVAFKKPTLLFTSANKIKQNIATLSLLLNVSEEKLVKAGLKCPNIFYQSPEKLNSNIDTSSEKLGIDKNRFVQAVLKMPTIISLSPQTINNTIINSSHCLNIEKDVFIKMALNHPNLFYQSAETLDANAKKLAETLGCTKQTIVQCAQKAPQILSMNPETINKNISENARLLNVAKDTVLKAAYKNPQLFYFKPESVYEKEKIKEFYKKIKNEDYELFSTNIQTTTVEAQYMQILCYLIKRELGSRKVEPIDLNKILENVSNRTIEIPEHELGKKFIDFSKKILPKNKIKILVK